MLLLALILHTDICPRSVSEVHPGMQAIKELSSFTEIQARWWKDNLPTLEKIKEKVFAGRAGQVRLERKDSDELCRDSSANLFVAESEPGYTVTFCPGMIALLRRLESADWEAIVTLLFSHEMGHILAFGRGEQASEVEADRFAARRLAETEPDAGTLKRGLRFFCGYPAVPGYPSGRERISSMLAEWRKAASSKSVRVASPEAPPAPVPPAKEHSGYRGRI